MKESNPRPLLLLCFANPEITDLLSLALDFYFDCELKSFSGVKELAGETSKAPILLVFDGTRDDAPALLAAAKALKAKVVIHHPKKQAPENAEGVNIEGVFVESDLLPGISLVLKNLGAKTKNAALEGATPSYPYLRVGIPLLVRTNPLVSDVYIKLSEMKFIKLFHKGAPFGTEEVTKYHDARKIEFLYVKQGESEKLTAKLNDTLESLLRETSVPLSVSTPVSLATIDTLHSLVNQVGFTPEVERLVKNNVDLVLKEMYESLSLGAILQNMEIDRDKYIATHSHMLAEVGCALSIAMKWDSEISFKKITLAALLHDMGLSDQKLARIKDIKELNEKRAYFSAADVDSYRTHPRRASVIVAGLKDVPADVDKIILQHHELPMGTGFPDCIQQTHIHPLASLLIVGHDLVDWVFDRAEEKLDVKSFIEAHSEKYKTGNFRKILKALYSLQT